MSNQIRNFRAALAQNDRNKSVYEFFVLEIIVVSLILAGIIGYNMDSDTAFCVGFVCITALLASFLATPILALITFIVLAIAWAAPFVAGGIYYKIWGWWFFAVCAFFISFIVNYWGYTYFLDLTANDD